MRLSFYLDKTADRPFFSIEIKDPESTRKRLLKISFALMGTWILLMWIDRIWNWSVPMYVSFPFVLVATGMWYFIAHMDEECRREKAKAKHTQQTVEARTHEQ